MCNGFYYFGYASAIDLQVLLAIKISFFLNIEWGNKEQMLLAEGNVISEATWLWYNQQPTKK
jgi:hypothetical protein